MSDLVLKLRRILHSLAIGEEGQDMVEYVLVLGLIAFGTTAAMSAMGSTVSQLYSKFTSTLA